MLLASHFSDEKPEAQTGPLEPQCYSFIKYLLNIYCVPGHLGTEDTTVNKLNTSPEVFALRKGGGKGGTQK